jgi:Mg-chelatase subunit ChlD
LSLRVDHPELLWLLLLIGPIAWLGARRLTTVEPVRRWAAVALRAVVLTLLVLMLAGLRAERRHTDLTVIAVIDQSPSMRIFAEAPEVVAGDDEASPAPSDVGHPASVMQAVRDYLVIAAADRRPDDRFGVVAYDARPTVLTRPGTEVRLDVSADRPVREGTDTAAAIEWAMASKADADTALRLVLVTDGNDTAGDTLAAARAAAAAGVVIDVLPVTYRVGQEVMVEGVYTPVEAREGQTVAVRVVLRATVPSRGTLQLRHDGRLLDLNGNDRGRGLPIAPGDWSDARVLTADADADDNGQDDGAASDQAAAGRYVLAKQIDVPIARAGANNFEAFYEPAPAAAVSALGRSGSGNASDTVAINNRAQSFTLVRGQGRVLLVDQLGGTPGRILPEALRRREINLDVIPASAFPFDAAALSRYDAVLFQNVPAELITGRQQTVLARYVNDLGGGFAMIGGPDSFGAGGWTNTVIDRSILPVNCEIPVQTVLPTGALVICLDVSGSMAMEVDNTGRSQLELAGEAAILAMQTLFPDDLIGLISFDSTPQWVVPLQENKNPGEATRLIRSMQPGGGTNLSAGLSLAHQTLSNQRFADRSVKHVILLTDGNEPAQNYQELMADFRDAGITLTTVGVGDSQNTPLLQDLAFRGDGTFYPIADPMDLPQVFIKEARLIRKNLVREGQFEPQFVNVGSPITANLPATPPLNGLVLTGPKYDRRVQMPMLGPEGEPLFAHWQVGLGRAAAWTSDATNRWATPWLDWPGYGDFWARTVRYISRPGQTQDAELTATIEDDTLRVRLDTSQIADDLPGNSGGETGGDGEASGAPAGSYTVAGKLLKPDGTVADITLQQTGPGLFTGRAPATETGSYLLNLFLQPPAGSGRSPKFVAGGATRVPGAELRRLAPNVALLSEVAAATGGRGLDPADPVAARLFDRNHRFESVSSRPLVWTLLPWLLALLLLDIANRRLAWDHREIAQWVRDKAAVQRRSSRETKQTLSALKRRRASTQENAPSSTNPPDPTPRPVPAGVAASRKFEAGPGAQPASDLAAAVGGASVDPAITPAAAASSTDEAEAVGTTNRLLAAKRRARQKNS